MKSPRIKTVESERVSQVLRSLRKEKKRDGSHDERDTGNCPKRTVVGLVQLLACAVRARVDET